MSSSLPLIDISDFTGGGDAGSRAVVDAVGEACETVGFMLIQGHGIGEELDGVYETAREFFALPLEEKLRCTPAERNQYCGFAPVGRGTYHDTGRPPNLVEMYHVNRYDSAEEALAAGLAPAAVLGEAPNLWPDNPPRFKRAWRTYYSAMEGLAQTMADIFALALGLGASHFSYLLDEHLSNLSGNWYPPQEETPGPGQIRSAAHVDFSLFTVLHRDDAPGGLEVRRRGGDWEAVPHVPGAFVVNLGDLMNRLTNDRWRATPHRVVNPPASACHRGRISVPYFVTPAYDAVIDCLPTCRPADGSEPRYPAVIAGPHAEERRSGKRSPTVV